MSSAYEFPAMLLHAPQIDVAGSSSIRQRLFELVPVLRDAAVVDSLDALIESPRAVAPALLVVILEWPDQYAASSVAQWFATFPETRIVCVASAWCASMNRSRGVWPIACVASWEQAASRIVYELDVVAGRAAPVPIMAGREEMLERTMTDATEWHGRGTVAVMSDDADVRAWMFDSLTGAGVECDASPEAVNRTMHVVMDGDPWTARKSAWMSNRSGRTLVLTSALDPAAHPAGEAIGVASKFGPVSEWLRHLIALAAVMTSLVSGCAPAPPQSAPSQQTTSAKTEHLDWIESIEAVRKGDSKSIVFEGAVSPEEWAELKSGCESLEFLEVPAAAISDDDLDFAASLPKLRRFTTEASVGDHGAELLARCKALAQVNLGQSVLTNAGLAHLCSLPLVQLRLGTPNVDDAGMAALVSVKSLKYLHLIDVPITDAALPTIAKIESLQSFYLDGGHCTEDALGALLKERPKLHFHLDQMHLPADPNTDGH